MKSHLFSKSVDGALIIAQLLCSLQCELWLQPTAINST